VVVVEAQAAEKISRKNSVEIYREDYGAKSEHVRRAIFEDKIEPVITPTVPSVDPK
jgi:hypothetical protein